MRKLLPILLAILILASVVWYGFVYDRDFTRDMLLQQARRLSTNGNANLASWFYDLAYEHSGQDESVAIELARQFKEDGNYTKAEYTLSNAIADGGTAELYVALCKTYVEQDKLQDAVNMLDNISDPVVKEQIEQMRPAAPVTDPAPGFYSQYIAVNLQGSEGVMYYTTDGEYPSIVHAPYEEPFTLSTGETLITAISVADSGLVSRRSIFSYTVGGVIEQVTFSDEVIEREARRLLGREDMDPLYSSELWNITSLSIPAEAMYFEDLEKFSYLQSLEIDGQAFDSLRFLSTLSDLTELKLTNCRIASNDLKTIAALPALQRLTISGCALSTVAGLEMAQNLEYLDLSNNTIRNLEPLAYMMKLQEINLQHNALTGLNALGGLTNLQKLNVAYNSLTSLAPLATCTRLNYLDAANNEIISLSGVDNLQKLTFLNVNTNALTDVALLEGNTALVELHIASNQIETIECLSGLANLEVFDFSANLVKALPQLPDNAKLRIIDGSHNEIKSLERLQNQMNLTHVYMDYNKIKTIDPLANCYKLVLVNVFGNNIEDVKKLAEMGVIVNWDPT